MRQEGSRGVSHGSVFLSSVQIGSAVWQLLPGRGNVTPGGSLIDDEDLSSPVGQGAVVGFGCQAAVGVQQVEDGLWRCPPRAYQALVEVDSGDKDCIGAGENGGSICFLSVC
jgi:hypothetical protein